MSFRLSALVLLASLSQAAADPLSDLLARDNGSACFERQYDKAHLAKNPDQKTRAVLLSLAKPDDRDSAIIRIRFDRSDGIFYLVGECSWMAQANLDVQDKPLIEAFKGPSGLDCHAMTSADGMSAEEGGDFPIDLKDGKAVTLYVPESLAAWRSFNRSGPADWLEFGKDDLVFRVDAAAGTTCQGLVDKLPWLE